MQKLTYISQFTCRKSVSLASLAHRLHAVYTWTIHAWSSFSIMHLSHESIKTIIFFVLFCNRLVPSKLEAGGAGKETPALKPKPKMKDKPIALKTNAAYHTHLYN